VSGRIYDLIGARIVSVEPSGDLVVFEVEHEGCDDDAAEIFVHPEDIEFRYPPAEADG